MDDSNRQRLVHNARTLYDLSRNMQKIMLEMFIDEFIDLDEEEEKMIRMCQEPPF